MTVVTLKMISFGKKTSAVHQSRRAGAGVCSLLVKLRRHLFVLQTIIALQRKNFSPLTKNRYSCLTIQLATNIQIMIIVLVFMYSCGICKTMEHVPILSRNFN